MWKATERDEAECVICFEEFEVGQDVARLECLCRYHKVSLYFCSLVSWMMEAIGANDDVDRNASRIGSTGRGAMHSARFMQCMNEIGSYTL